MSDNNVSLMTVIEAVANEAFEKFLLAKLEALVDAKIGEYSRSVSEAVGALDKLDTALSDDLDRLTRRVDELEDRSGVSPEGIREVVDMAIDEIDWNDKVNENLDMDEIVADLDVSSAVDSYMEGLDFSEALRNSGVDWNEVLDGYMESVMSRLSINYTHE